ncbi:MAG: GntR family transcriptional regulator [Bacteroidales bacterium]
MEFNQDKPIYLQITNYICEQILKQTWQENERIPSVRNLSVDLAVNPNTIMRAYEQLDKFEIIFNKRGIGFFVQPNANKNIKILYRKEFLEDELPSVFQKMELLEISMDEIGIQYNMYHHQSSL